MCEETKDTRLKFLMEASLLYQDSCPEQSRFLMRRHQRIKAPGRLETICKEAHCPFCFQRRCPDNHRHRLRPKRRASTRVQKVLQREARGKRLSLAQRDILRRFRSSSSALMATCHTCNKTTRHYGMNRDVMAHLSRSHSTPGSASKCKTPKSANRANMGIPKSASKEKTPCSTPRSISETTSTPSSKPASVKKSAFSRLRKLLMLEDSQKSKKGGLKDFLSSL